MGLPPENWPYSSDACSRPQFHTLIQGQPGRPAWLKRVLQTHPSEAGHAAAYVTNVTWGGVPPRQTGSHTSSSQMCSALYLTLIEQPLRGQISLVQNRKRRRERRWGAPPRWLARDHKQVTCRTAGTWVPPASRPSPDPAAGYSAFSGVQGQVSSEIRQLWRSLPEMECYSTWPKEAPPPVGRLIFWSSVCEKMITKENWS